MKSAVFKAICITSALLIFLSTGGVLITLYDRQEEERLAVLDREIVYIEEGYNASGAPYLAKVQSASATRITLISPQGQVLFDSNAKAEEMENHSGRPEIEEALEKGESRILRRSETLGKSTYYLARKTEDGNVLRISVTEGRLVSMIDRSATVICLILLLCVGLAALVAKQITAAVMAPINKLNLDEPLKNDIYEEFSPLLVRMDRQNKRIEEQMEELKAKQQEFALITENMEDAFVVFSAEERVLSANRAAARLFGKYDLKDFKRQEICKDKELNALLEDAFSGRSTQKDYVKEGRSYLVSAYPVTNGERFAAVLFANDVTHKEQAEKMRREFTANVSHELKTPLTTIMGCSEIIEAGIAKPEDHRALSGQIHKEAARLLALIEDIIKLSRLDEGQIKDAFLKTDLYLESETVLEELAQKAKASGVTLSLSGENASVSGIPSTLHEMIFNLCDNAIIYNRPGGSVTVLVRMEKERVVLKVLDTGIGIEESHKERVFERFYRVDKSRSRASGGTGLGLSIVKHGAQLHGAELSLESTPGKGTTVTLTFPPLAE
jgi:two-component system phosphate regulon sensor histidine kinase PhoR